LQPQLVSNFPEKSVVGDYTADSNPLASSWITYDLLGGIGSSTYDTGSEKHCWWTDCIIDYEGNITLPRNATAITTFNAKSVTPTWVTPTVGSGTGWSNPTYAYDGNVATYAQAGSPATAPFTYTITPNWYGQVRYHVNRAAAGVTGVLVEIYDGAAWSTIATGAPAGGWNAWTTVDITDQFITSIRLTSQTSGDLLLIEECQAETASPGVPSGTLGRATNFNGELYWVVGNHLVKLDSGRASFTGVQRFATAPTAIVPSLNGKLYIFLGDSYTYAVMTTAEAFSVGNASGYWAFQWDNKLFKVLTNGTVHYSINPDAASPTWTASATITDIASQIESFALGDDFMEGTVPYCATNTSLRFLNFTDASWDNTALSLPGLANSGKGFCHWRDGLYISSGLDVIKFQSAQVPMITNVSMLKGGGIPSEYNGHIVKLCGDGTNEMFAAVDASQLSGTQKSGLYAWDDIGWKCWWVDSANDSAMAEIIVSNAESGYAVYWSCGSTIYYIDTPQGIRNPTYLATETFASSGTLYTSWFDGGWLVGNKRVNKVRIGTKGVSATETLVVKYRTNKVNTDLSTGWTTLGTITSGTETSYTFGSGIGQIFSSIQFCISFARGATTTSTPIAQYITMEYNKLIPKVWGWQMTLDCSSLWHDVPPKTLLSNLVTAAETETLITLVYVDTTYYVEVVSVTGSRLTGGEIEKGRYAVFVREIM
jgi:hypothetical protein